MWKRFLMALCFILIPTLAHSATFDFSLTNGGDRSVTQGDSVTNTITATLLSGGSQSVSFSARLPTGVIAKFSPGACKPTCTTRLTITTTTSTPVGPYTLTVTGTGGGVTRTTSFTLTINAAPFDFSLTNGGDQAVIQGNSVSNTIAATLLLGTSQSVSFTVSGLPSGVVASFSSASCPPTCSTTLTIATTTSTPLGPYTLTVTGTGGGVTRTTSFTLTVTAPTATTYYVNITGSDKNTCTQAQNSSTPKRTINAALNCLGTAAGAGTGHTVQMAPGTYVETIDNNLPGGTSWSAPFTLKAATIGTVTIQPPVGARCLTIARATSKYAIISGLVCDGVNVADDGIKITDSSSGGAASFIRIQDTEIKNVTAQGILVTRSTDNEFIHITAHDNGTTDNLDHGIYIGEASHRTLIEDSTFYNNHAYGIHLYDATTPPDGCLVRNNRAYTNGTGGLVIWATNTVAYNNLIYNNHTPAGNLLRSTKSGIKVGSNSNGVKLYNNTVYGQKANSGDMGIEISSGAVNTEVKNNIVYNDATSIADSGTGTTLAANLTTNPQFVDEAATNFTLQGGSPAIDTGVTLSAVPDDYAGVLRPQGLAYDIGAYEYVFP